MRVFVVGGTGTAGRAAVSALLRAGHEVVCLVRAAGALPSGAEARLGDVTDAASVQSDGFRGEKFDAVVCCLTSRSGIPADAWRMDHDAPLTILNAAQTAGVKHFVLLSAICVQKPHLAFQRAKLAFEAELVASGLTYSIVRPTAFFKSLSGQAERVRAGKPFLVFGDGRLTACTPISDRDLGRFLADCLTDPTRQNQVLPIGGPGPAMTPLDLAAALSEAMGQPTRVRRVPVALMRGIIGLSTALGWISSAWADKAERARIGLYYATESMLVLNPETDQYDRAATPSFGSDTIADHYAALAKGDITVDLGDHAMF